MDVKAASSGQKRQRFQCGRDCGKGQEGLIRRLRLYRRDVHHHRGIVTYQIRDQRHSPCKSCNRGQTALCKQGARVLEYDGR